MILLLELIIEDWLKKLLGNSKRYQKVFIFLNNFLFLFIVEEKRDEDFIKRIKGIVNVEEEETKQIEDDSINYKI